MSQSELEILIEERIMSINNVHPQEPSKKRITDGGIAFVNDDSSITITPNPLAHEIVLNTDENVVQRRIESMCGPDAYATSVLVNGTIVCGELSQDFVKLDYNGMLDPTILPLTTLQIQGDWNAELNEPFLEQSDCNNYTYGFFYTVNVPSENEWFGYSNWTLQDWLLCSMNMGWVKNSHSSQVLSVNGEIGTVNIDIQTDNGLLSTGSL